MSEPLREDIMAKLREHQSQEWRQIFHPQPQPQKKTDWKAPPAIDAWQGSEGAWINPARPKKIMVPANDMERLQAIVASMYGIPIDMMTSPRRSAQWAHPRQAAMSIARSVFPQWSLPHIGKLFGGRDHTTVMHAIRVCEDRLSDSAADWAEWRAKYREAEAACRAAFDR